MSAAAAAAARSPSPGPARPCCGLRRSADSSPFRTISSAPDSPQRSASVGKTGGRSRASWGEKENDSNNHPRDAARTPKAAARHSIGGGGAKSFMAPTFSAASKAVAPSSTPRKKVLGERNNDLPHHHQHQQHPIPSSPGEMAHGKPSGPPPPPPEEPLGAPRRLQLSLDGAASAPPVLAAPVAAHGAWRSLGGEAEEEEEVVVENPVCKIHNHHHDESGGAAAPYDPKTNYLSPRPRFLRYRPNPRVEQYRQGSGGGRRLEEGFPSSESSEEADTTTTTEEEGLSEEEQEQTPTSPEASSALAPASDARADPATPVAAGVLQPDPAPVSPLPRVQAPEPEESVVTSPRSRSPAPELEPAAIPALACAKKKKRSSLRFLLVAPLALVLFMVASLVCVPPHPGSPVVLNASLSKVSGYFLSVQELHPVELAAWLKQWSSSSLDFVSSYWNALASPQEQEFYGPHTAANLSAAAADDADNGVGFYYSAAEQGPVPTEQEPISASIIEQELEIQEVVSASDTVVIAEPEVEKMAAFDDATVEDEPIDGVEMVQESVTTTSDVIEEELNELNAEMAEEISGSIGEEMAPIDQDLDIPSQSEPEPEHVVDDMDVPSLQQDLQTDGSEGDQDAHVEEDQEAHHGQKLGSDHMWSGYLDQLSKPAVGGSILAVLIVSAALAFHYKRQYQARVSLNSSEPAEYESAEPVEQVENRSGSGSSEGHTLAKGSPLQHPVVEETERIGGAGGSQYSSSLSSGLGRRKKDKVEDSVQSLEPTSRRDSTAFSTSSYGSFTTYEKISAKKRNKEDEAMTPVRRSSRLRNQVKSPEA